MLGVKRVRVIMGTASSNYNRYASNPPPKKPPPKKTKVLKVDILPSKINEITSNPDTTPIEKVAQLRAFNIKTQFLYKNEILILINLLRGPIKSLPYLARRGNDMEIKKLSNKIYKDMNYKDSSSMSEKGIIYKHIGIHRSQDIKRSILIVSTFMVSTLKTKNNILVNDIFELLKTKLGATQKDFMFAINFLFAIGIIEYQANTDELRYLK